MVEMKVKVFSYLNCITLNLFQVYIRCGHSRNMKIFTIVCFVLHTGVLGFLQVQWLPCKLKDENVWKNVKNETETKYIHRDVMLHFGNLRDSALYPENITFHVAASKVDMRKYVEGPVDQLQCEISRYSKGLSRVRWPSLGGTEHDVWFTCTLSHTAGLFKVTSFLRVTPATTMSPHQPDFHSWITLRDNEKLSASAVMVVLTRSPSVWVALLKQQTLHCQFAVDHKAPHLTVEWYLKKHGGQQTRLYSYSSSSGQTEGSGVAVDGIARGDASLTLPLTEMSSEGIYLCSVNVPPLSGSVAIALHIMESPQVSLTIEQGSFPRVWCEAMGYYPLDVEIELFKETSSGEHPKKLENVIHRSHTQHNNGTFSLPAFVRLQPSPLEPGCGVYSCRVKHVSLQGLYIYKGITEPGCLTWINLILPGIMCLFAVIIIFIAVTKRGCLYFCKRGIT
ncbi:hypothetical protein UPYG_G00240590 [Umbra pygmaea]|uniref:Ig-like domain-containing protein n=1 Tax=Umbra pygmaea TaxID=75934 RepID=A0ABD0WF79_UMBPY